MCFRLIFRRVWLFCCWGSLVIGILDYFFEPFFHRNVLVSNWLSRIEWNERFVLEEFYRTLLNMKLTWSTLFIVELQWKPTKSRLYHGNQTRTLIEHIFSHAVNLLASIMCVTQLIYYSKSSLKNTFKTWGKLSLLVNKWVGYFPNHNI